VISLNGQNILFALKENAIHRRSKPEDPSTECNRHRFGVLIGIADKRKQYLTCIQKILRAKLEQLDMQRL
jgi:hypothetical protein